MAAQAAMNASGRRLQRLFRAEKSRENQHMTYENRSSKDPKASGSGYEPSIPGARSPKSPHFSDSRARNLEALTCIGTCLDPKSM